jgi:hypothetical protein
MTVPYPHRYTPFPRKQVLIKKLNSESSSFLVFSTLRAKYPFYAELSGNRPKIEVPHSFLPVFDALVSV